MCHVSGVFWAYVLRHDLHQNTGFQVIKILLPSTPRILLEVTGQVKNITHNMTSSFI